MAARGLVCLLLPWLWTSSCAPGQEGPAAATESAAPAPAPAPAPALPAIAIRPADPALATAVRAGSFFRWALPRLEGLKIQVGAQAEGDLEIVADLLPAEPATRALVAGLPVRLDGTAIVLDGTSYRAPGQALAVRVPREGKAQTWVVAGGGLEATSALVDDLLFRHVGRRRRGRPAAEIDYLLRETRYLERSGRWRLAAGEVEIDRASERDDLAARDRAFAGLTALGGERVRLLVPAGEAGRPEFVRLAAELDRAAGAMAERIPLPLDNSPGGPPVTVALEPDHVRQGRHAGAVGEAVPGGRTDLSLVWHPDDLYAYRHALARALLARADLDLPPWLERGAALWLSGDWFGRPWPEWLPVLAAARALPSAAELLALEEQEDASAPLWTPAAAAVVERLPGRTVREKLARTPPAARVERILAALARTPAPARAEVRTRTLRRPFLRGISLAMVNSLEDGYHSPALARRLDELSRLGVDAVSLMPFAYQAAPDGPELSFLNGSPESESDTGLVHATRLARARGFTVLYKPHIWVSWESWPGDVGMRSEADWQAWWRSYRRYVLHHALLAAWAGSDLYSVGVELSKTLGRQAEWRDLIAAARLFFPGALTYSGNWHGDLEKAGFWDRLDYVGVDAYFPLSASPEASQEELEQGARRVVEQLAAAARRTGKPLLLTEVGFPAHRGSWLHPHTEGGEFSEEDQARSYQALLGALGRPPWLAGTFFWKAFTADTSAWRREEADFRFLGRKAEAVVREYYSPRAGL